MTTDASDRLTDARLLLTILKFDPDTHRLVAVQGQFPGIAVEHDGGERVAFYTLRQLKQPKYQERMDTLGSELRAIEMQAAATLSGSL